MNKKRTIFILFFIHVCIYGMHNPDILLHIAPHVCFANKYKPLEIKNNIKNLTLTNKFFHDYYAKEETKQNIIRACALFNNSNDYNTAHVLGCYKIKEKIDYFINIAQNNILEFSKDDLKHTWYLNTTIFIPKRALPCNQSLLYIALDHAHDTNTCNLEKVKAIIDNSPNLNFLYGEGQNILSRICFFRHYIKSYISDKSPLLDDLLDIAKAVLDKGMLADGHTKRSQHTPLMLTTMNQDEPLARLLLEYGASACAKTYQYMVGATEQCAFDMNGGIYRKWLENLVNEVKIAKNRKSQNDI